MNPNVVRNKGFETDGTGVGRSDLASRATNAVAWQIGDDGRGLGVPSDGRCGVVDPHRPTGSLASSSAATHTHQISVVTDINTQKSHKFTKVIMSIERSSLMMNMNARHVHSYGGHSSSLMNMNARHVHSGIHVHQAMCIDVRHRCRRR